jgi:hypothetical protein
MDKGAQRHDHLPSLEQLSPPAATDLMNVLKISVIELIQALRQMIPNLTGK